MKKVFWILIIVGIAVVLAVGAYAALTFFYQGNPRINENVSYIQINTSEIGVNQISYLLYSINADNLHSPVLSSETPKIEVIVGGITYNSEVIKARIVTSQKAINDPDLRIRLSEQEFIAALKSTNVKEYLIESVKQEKTTIETIAGELELFSKGYLTLYNQLKGK